MANRKLSCAMLYRWFKCKLKPPKKEGRETSIPLSGGRTAFKQWPEKVRGKGPFLVNDWSDGEMYGT